MTPGSATWEGRPAAVLVEVLLRRPLPWACCSGKDQTELEGTGAELLLLLLSPLLAPNEMPWVQIPSKDLFPPGLACRSQRLLLGEARATRAAPTAAGRVPNADDVKRPPILPTTPADAITNTVVTKRPFRFIPGLPSPHLRRPASRLAWTARGPPPP